MLESESLSNFDLEYRLRDGVEFQPVGDSSEGVLLSIESGFLYRCNRSATAVLAAIKDGKNVGQIVERLCQEYDAATDQISTDVQTTLDQLSEEELIVPAA